MQKVSVFRSGIMVRNEVNDEIQRSIFFIKDEFQISIEKMYRKEEKRKNPIGCMLMD